MADEFAGPPLPEEIARREAERLAAVLNGSEPPTDVDPLEEALASRWATLSGGSTVTGVEDDPATETPAVPEPGPDPVVTRDQLYQAAYEFYSAQLSDPIEAGIRAQMVVDAVIPEVEPIPAEPTLAEQFAISYSTRRIGEDQRPLSEAARKAYEGQLALRRELREGGYPDGFQGPPARPGFTPDDPEQALGAVGRELAIQGEEMARALAEAAGQYALGSAEEYQAEIRALIAEEAAKGRTLEDRVRDSLTVGKTLQRAVPFAETVWPDLRKDRLAIEYVNGQLGIGKDPDNELTRRLLDFGEPFETQEGMPAENDLMYWLRVLPTTISSAVTETVERFPLPEAPMVTVGRIVTERVGPDAPPEVEAAAGVEVARTGAALRQMTLGEAALGFEPGELQRIRRTDEGWGRDGLQGFLERVERGSSLEEDFALAAERRLGPEWSNHGWWAGLALDALIDWEGFVGAPVRVASRAAREASAVRAAVPTASWQEAIRATRDPEFDLGKFVGDHAVDAVDRGGLDALPDPIRVQADRVADEYGVTVEELFEAEGRGSVEQVGTRMEGGEEVSARADLEAVETARRSAIAASGNAELPGGGVAAPRPSRRTLTEAEAVERVDRRPPLPPWALVNNETEFFGLVGALARDGRQNGSAPKGFALKRHVGFQRIRGANPDPSAAQYTVRNAKGGYVTPQPVDFNRAVYLMMKRGMDGDVVTVDGQRTVARWGKTVRGDGSVRLVADYFFAAPTERRIIGRVNGDASGQLATARPARRARGKRTERGAVPAQPPELAQPPEVPPVEAVIRTAIQRVVDQASPQGRGNVPRAERRAAARRAKVTREAGETRQQARARAREQAPLDLNREANALTSVDPSLTPSEAQRIAAEGGAAPAIADGIRARLLDGDLPEPVARVLDEVAAESGARFTDVWAEAREAAIREWAQAAGRDTPDVVTGTRALATVEELVERASGLVAERFAGSRLEPGSFPIGDLDRAGRRARVREAARARRPERQAGETRAAYRERLRRDVLGRIQADARVIVSMLGEAGKRTPPARRGGGISMREAMDVASAPDFELASWLTELAQRVLDTTQDANRLPAPLREAMERVAMEGGFTLGDVVSASNKMPEDALRVAAGNWHFETITGAPPARRAVLPVRLEQVIRDASRLVANDVVAAERLKMLPTRALVAPREYKLIMDEVGRRMPSYERARKVGARLAEGAEFHLPDAERLRLLAARAGIPEAQLHALTPGTYNHLRRQAVREVAGVVAEARFGVRGQAPFVSKMLSAIRSFTLSRRRRSRLSKLVLPDGSYRQQAVKAFLDAFATNPAETLAPEARLAWEQIRRRIQASPDDVIREFQAKLRDGADPTEALVQIAGRYGGPTPQAIELAEDVLARAKTWNTSELVALGQEARPRLAAALGDRIPESLLTTDPVLYSQALIRWAEDAQAQVSVTARRWIESVLATQGTRIAGTIDQGRLASVVDTARASAIYREVFGRGELFGPATVEVLGQVARREGDDAGPLSVRVDTDAAGDALAAFALRLHQEAAISDAMQFGMESGLLVRAPRAGSPQENVLAAVLGNTHWVSRPDGTRRYLFPEPEIRWAEGQLARWGIEPGSQASIARRQIGRTDVALPTELAERLDQMTRAGFFEGRRVNSLDGYNTLLALWKESRLHGLLVPRPSYFLGQILGTGPMLWASRGLGGMVSAAGTWLRHPALISDLLARHHGVRLPDRVVTPYVTSRTGQVYDPDALFDAARAGGLFDSQSRYETGSQLAEVVAARNGPKMLGWIRQSAAWWQGVLRDMGSAFEQTARLSVYLDEVKRGTPPERASIVAVNSLPNYRDLTEFEREWMRNVFTFYAFQRKSADLYTLALLTNPGRVMAQLRLARDSTRGEEPLVSRALKVILRLAGGEGNADLRSTRSAIERGAMREEDLARLVVWEEDGVYSGQTGEVNPLYSHMDLRSPPVGVADYLLTMRLLMSPSSAVTEGTTEQRRLVQSLTPVGQALAIAFLNQNLTGPYDRDAAMRIPAEVRRTPGLGAATDQLFLVGPVAWRDDPRLADKDASDLLGGPAVWAAGGDPTYSPETRQLARKAWAGALLLAGGVLGNDRELETALGLRPPPPDLTWGEVALTYPIGLRWSPSYSELELIRRARSAQANRAKPETVGVEVP